MTPTEPRYDLVFFGTDLQGAQRVDALAKLAQLMKVPPDQLGTILDQRGGVIARGLASESGSEAQRKLMAIGIRCNLRPSGGWGAGLELVPMEQQANKVVCPACGQVHRKPEGDTPAPETCESCGVVFAKYDKVALEKKEREQVRRALLARQQGVIEQERKDRELREAQERRKKLEEEIRRELGLPRIIASRTRLIGSAAGIYLLGLLMGATGLIGYDLLVATESDASEPTPLTLNALAASQSGIDPSLLSGSNISEMSPFATSAFAGAESEQLDPGVVAQMQIAGLLNAAPGSVAAPQVAQASTFGAGGADPHRPGDLEFLDNKLSDLKTDAEWDLYVLARIDALRERGDAQRAAILVDHLRNPELRFDRGALLADSYWRQGRMAEAEELNLDLSAAADRLPDSAGSRVSAFCALARQLQKSGRPNEADALRIQATTIAAAVANPADKAAADSEIAALFSDLGRTQDARARFLAATRGLGSIADPADRLSAVAWIARSYAKAGYRASALSLLEEAVNNIDSIGDPEARARILGLIAQTNGLLGDMKAAKETAARILSPTAKDRTLYRLASAEIASDRLANAIDLTEGLQTPAYRALAFALLGLRQQKQPADRALAARSTEEATGALAMIGDPAEKLAVTAELGVSRPTTATRRRPMAILRTRSDSRNRSPRHGSRPRMAILATNEGLALRPADARLDLRSRRLPTTHCVSLWPPT